MSLARRLPTSSSVGGYDRSGQLVGPVVADIGPDVRAVSSSMKERNRCLELVGSVGDVTGCPTGLSRSLSDRRP